MQQEDKLEAVKGEDYRRLIVEVEFYLPENGRYRFREHFENRLTGLKSENYVNGNLVEFGSTTELGEGNHSIMFVFKKDPEVKDNIFIQNFVDKKLDFFIIVEYFDEKSYKPSFVDSYPPPVTWAEVTTKKYTLDDWRNSSE